MSDGAPSDDGKGGAEPKEPFVCLEVFDEGNLVGARWWQESMAFWDPVARRQALLGFSAFLATVTVAGSCAVLLSDPSSQVERDMLQLQRERGWNFGASSGTLSYAGYMEAPVPPGAVQKLLAVTTPRSTSLQPYACPTLFQSVAAAPTDGTVPPPLVESLRSIHRPSMDEAFGRGAALASLFRGAPSGRAVIVDLPGPESVAFAAGLSSDLEPIFWFDNWPHPQGLVPAHLTLGALFRYLDVFERTAQTRLRPCPMVFVLDENRLLPHGGSPDVFDNRYMARLPTAAAMKGLGIQQILYVRSQADALELDDLNALFVEYAREGIVVNALSATAFVPGEDPSDAVVRKDAGALSAGSMGRSVPRYVYGGPSHHYWFWPTYGWGSPPRPAERPLGLAPPTYRPAPRQTIFGDATQRVPPRGFGMARGPASSSGGGASGSSSSSSWGSWGRSSSGFGG